MTTNTLQNVINNSPAATTLGGTEKFLITQGGVQKQATPAQIATYTGGGGGGGASTEPNQILATGQVLGNNTGWLHAQAFIEGFAVLQDGAGVGDITIDGSYDGITMNAQIGEINMDTAGSSVILRFKSPYNYIRMTVLSVGGGSPTFTFLRGA